MKHFIPIEGTFEFLDAHSREMLEDAYQAIAIADAWTIMKNYPNEHVCSTNSNIICLQYAGHSGSSYEWTMKVMQFLANNGWVAFYEAFCPTH